MKNARKIKVVELFSGIGSQAKALKNIGANFEIVGTCEWDIHAMSVYDIINNSDSNIYPNVIDMCKEDLILKLSKYTLSLDCKNELSLKTLRTFNDSVLKMIYSSILKNKNHVNITELKGTELPNEIDLLTYSFPCQDLSNVGSFHGYNKGIDRNSGSRSSLLWQVERILLERKKANMKMPKFLMLENVKSLTAPRHIENFKEWQKQLSSLGYYNRVYLLKAEEMGSAQRRHRIIMISVFVNGFKSKKKRLERYFEINNLENWKRYDRNKKKILKECLRTNYSKNKYLFEALECQPNDTSSRRSIWTKNPKLLAQNGKFLPLVPTLTTKQDRHPNAGNIFFNPEGNKRSKFRYLTPRECFLLMGFDEGDFEKIKKSNFKSRKNSTFFRRDKLIRLAGNSISIEMLEEVFKQILEIDRIINC